MRHKIFNINVAIKCKLLSRLVDTQPLPWPLLLPRKWNCVERERKQARERERERNRWNNKMAYRKQVVWLNCTIIWQNQTYYPRQSNKINLRYNRTVKRTEGILCNKYRSVRTDKRSIQKTKETKNSPRESTHSSWRRFSTYYYIQVHQSQARLINNRQLNENDRKDSYWHLIFNIVISPHKGTDTYLIFRLSTIHVERYFQLDAYLAFINFRVHNRRHNNHFVYFQTPVAQTNRYRVPRLRYVDTTRRWCCNDFEKSRRVIDGIRSARVNVTRVLAPLDSITDRNSGNLSWRCTLETDKEWLTRARARFYYSTNHSFARYHITSL